MKSTLLQMNRFLFIIASLFSMSTAYSQTNTSVTNNEAKQIIFGNYSISSYPGLNVVSDHDAVLYTNGSVAQEKFIK